MNRSERMRAALADGRWHTRHDIFNHAGAFFLTNNASSELRARGFMVEERKHGGNVEYRILGSEPAASGSVVDGEDAQRRCGVHPSGDRPAPESGPEFFPRKEAVPALVSPPPSAGQQLSLMPTGYERAAA